MNARVKKAQTICVSFSGIDGSGKSTQIDALREAAEQAGLRVETVRFWGNIARLTSLRESSSHTFFKGDRGIGSPSRPIHRRDKNVRSLPMSCMRLVIYAVDAFSTRAAISKARRSGADLFIFDRYLYDELANLPISKALVRFYIRAIMLLTPRPDLSFVLDAEPQAARARKPEYPIDFVYVNRYAYLELCRIIEELTVISPGPIEDVKREVLNHVRQRLMRRAGVHSSNLAFRELAREESTATSDEVFSRPAV